MTTTVEAESLTNAKLHAFFKQKKGQEEKDKNTTIILPRALTSPSNEDESEDFTGYPRRIPEMTHSRWNSQSTYESGKEYGVDQTVYYDGIEKDLDIDQLLEEESDDEAPEGTQERKKIPKYLKFLRKPMTEDMVEEELKEVEEDTDLIYTAMVHSLDKEEEDLEKEIEEAEENLKQQRARAFEEKKNAIQQDLHERMERRKALKQ